VIWLCLAYLIGLTISFLILESLGSVLGNYIFDYPEHDYTLDTVIPRPFWQQAWLDLKDLTNLRQNWFEAVCLMIWPIIWAIVGGIICVVISIGLGLWIKELFFPDRTIPEYQPH
jgi:hypothetical protein